VVPRRRRARRRSGRAARPRPASVARRPRRTARLKRGAAAPALRRPRAPVGRYRPQGVTPRRLQRFSGAQATDAPHEAVLRLTGAATRRRRPRNGASARPAAVGRRRGDGGGSRRQGGGLHRRHGVDGEAAPTRLPNIVGRVAVIDWHKIGFSNLLPPNSTETYAQSL